MATTRAKIWTALRRAAKRETWDDIEVLAEALEQGRDDDFKLDGKPLSRRSILGTLDLMVVLDFLAEQEHGAVVVTATGRAALASQEKFNLKTQSAIRSYMQGKGLPLEQILKAIRQITLPDVPDADTIHKVVHPAGKEDRSGIPKGTLRRLLFLYALAGGMSRRVRVFYGE